MKKLDIEKTKNTAKIFKNIFTGANILFTIILVALVIGSAIVIITPGKYFTLEKITKFGTINVNLASSRSYDISTMLLPNTNLKVLILIALIAIIFTIMLINFIVLNLKYIMKTIESERPFQEENSKRISYIGVCIIGLSVVNIAYGLIGWKAIEPNLLPGFNGNFIIQLHLEYAVLGALIVFLSWIFRYGAYLQQEYDETV